MLPSSQMPLVKHVRDFPMRSGRSTSFTQKLIGVALFLAMQLAWTASASATCGDHLQSHSPSMTEHLPSDSLASQPLEAPRPTSPCRGLNCSKGTPLVPAPLPMKVSVEDQPCWFAIGELAIEDAGFAKHLSADEFRLPERRSARLDRPPRAA